MSFKIKKNEKEFKKKQILEVLEVNGDWRKLARSLQVPKSTAYRWVSEGETVDKRGGKRFEKIREIHLDFFVEEVKKNSKITLAQLAASFQQKFNATISKTTISNHLDSISCTLKHKRSRAIAESNLCLITDPPQNPMEMIKKILGDIAKTNPIIQMNLATRNKEFGVLNRTVIYRGLTNKEESGDAVEENIKFVTETCSVKYKDIQEDPRIAVTICYPIPTEDDKINTYQIRLNGLAKELTKKQISEMWSKESVYAKIRSKISECGKPIDWNILKNKHDSLLQAYNCGADDLEQSPTYTVFQIIPNLIDFYFSEPNSIADRVVYRKDCGKWTFSHASP